MECVLSFLVIAIAFLGVGEKSSNTKSPNEMNASEIRSHKMNLITRGLLEPPLLRPSQGNLA